MMDNQNIKKSIEKVCDFDFMTLGKEQIALLTDSLELIKKLEHQRLWEREVTLNYEENIKVLEEFTKVLTKEVGRREKIRTIISDSLWNDNKISIKLKNGKFVSGFISKLGKYDLQYQEQKEWSQYPVKLDYKDIEDISKGAI